MQEQMKTKDGTNIFYSNYNDTSEVYKKQQRPFNIINLYAKNTQPLRKYPKLTKELEMLERGIEYQK